MKISKIFHQIWLGEKPMHPLMVAWQRKWMELHPTWDFHLWTEEEDRRDTHLSSLRLQPGPGNPCFNLRITNLYPQLTAKACHLAQRANIWRYQILLAFGGIYLDTDIEPHKPIDELIGERSAFVVPRIDSKVIYENAIFGTVPGHRWIQALVDRLPEKDPTVSLSMGVDYFTPISLKFSEVSALPRGAFVFEYPLPDPWAKIQAGETIPPPAPQIPPTDAYGVHHWSSHWFPQGFSPLHKAANEVPR